MLADGINTVFAISEYHAMHLILLLNLKHSFRKNSTQTNFLFIGEINYLSIEVRYQEIKVKPGRYEYTLAIRGSLHKYSHGNNDGNFLFEELQNTVEEIYKMFNIEAITMYPDGNIKAMEQGAFQIVALKI